MTVLDFCAGSLTTAIAALLFGRRARCVEMDADCVAAAYRRIAKTTELLKVYNLNLDGIPIADAEQALQIVIVEFKPLLPEDELR